MIDKGFYAFDPEKFANMFKVADMSKFFEQVKMPGFDADAMIAAQKKNMDALMEANRAAAAGYQDLFKKQVAIFEETMAVMQGQLADLKFEAMTPETAKAQADAAKVAFEKAVANMNELAEAAKKANTDAFDIVQARIKESIDEMKALTEKFTA